jgi:RNA polymerase sigma factor (sigma-70 family)
VELVTNARDERPVLESDEALWRGSLAGDGEAFGALFDRHHERVFRHACRLASSRNDAEDVAASAFLELWRCRDKVQLVDGSVLPWLLVTTTNLGRNAVRAKRRYRDFLEQLPRARAQPDVAEVALDVHALGVDGRLRDGLRALGKTDAQLFTLVALEGYPVGAAADLLGVSTAAARTRLHRVRVRLRASLSEDAGANWTEDQGGTR